MTAAAPGFAALLLALRLQGGGARRIFCRVASELPLELRFIIA